MSKLIQLANNRGVAIVDNADAPRVNAYLWSVFPNGNLEYARTGRASNLMLLHRFVLNLKRGDPGVDHINGNGLDCRKSNLRIAGQKLNQANIRKVKPHSSQYKGVFRRKSDGKWMVQICINYKSIHLGQFSDEAEAARCYDQAALAAWGDFANLNFPIKGASQP